MGLGFIWGVVFRFPGQGHYFFLPVCSGFRFSLTGTGFLCFGVFFLRVGKIVLLQTPTSSFKNFQGITILF